MKLCSHGSEWWNKMYIEIEFCWSKLYHIYHTPMHKNICNIIERNQKVKSQTMLAQQNLYLTDGDFDHGNLSLRDYAFPTIFYLTSRDFDHRNLFQRCLTHFNMTQIKGFREKWVDHDIIFLGQKNGRRPTNTIEFVHVLTHSSMILLYLCYK